MLRDSAKLARKDANLVSPILWLPEESAQVARRITSTKVNAKTFVLKEPSRTQVAKQRSAQSALQDARRVVLLQCAPHARTAKSSVQTRKRAQSHH